MAVTQARNPMPWRKIAGIGLVLIPIFILANIGIGEIVNGQAGGLMALLFAVPLVVLAVVGWRNPHLAGKIIVAVDSVLAVLFGIAALGAGSVQALLIGEAIFFFPAMLAGVLLLAAARRGD